MIPPVVFFRMLLIGYFEDIDSQRGIAWRCSDSLSLRTFLGLKPTESSPEHSSLTVIRKRMPKELIEQVFAFVVKVAFEQKLLKGKAIGVDAAMESIVRRDGGATWNQYLAKLAKETGIEARPTISCGSSIARGRARRPATTTGSRRAIPMRASRR